MPHPPYFGKNKTGSQLALNKGKTGSKATEKSGKPENMCVSEKPLLTEGCVSAREKSLIDRWACVSYFVAAVIAQQNTFCCRSFIFDCRLSKRLRHFKNDFLSFSLFFLLCKVVFFSLCLFFFDRSNCLSNKNIVEN